MKFETISGSIYEVDELNKKVRRLSGTQPPRENQGKDGEWQSYKEIFNLKEKHSAYIFWDVPVVADGDYVKLPATITSIIKKIHEDNLK